MTLIKCSECNKEVSEKAPHCPHCGNPINDQNVSVQSVQIDTAPQKRRKYRIMLLFFVPIFIVGAFATLASIFSESDGRLTFWIIVGLVGFAGTVTSSIGSWLSKS